MAGSIAIARSSNRSHPLNAPGRISLSLTMPNNSLACCLVSLLLIASASAATIDVSPGAATIQEAITKARATTRPATLRLRGGTYFLDEPIVLTIADSNLTVEAADGESP